MNAPPPLSVGMPVFQGEAFLAEALDSVLAQDFGDFEVLISDNASTDGTEDISAEYVRRDTRVRYIRNERNVGAARNYNQVVHLTTGRCFKWAAHDDRLAPQFFSRGMDVLESDASVTLVYSITADIDRDGNELTRYRAGNYASSSDPVMRAADIIQRPSPCYETFGIVRRDALERTKLIGPYRSSDRTLLLELALQGRFYEVDAVLFLHRQHPGRSVHLPSSEMRLRWFDPEATGPGYPTWRLGREYLAAIMRSGLPPKDRLRTMALIPGWTAAHRTRLVRECGRAVLSGATAERSRERQHA
jgi:glycosyltransferase involved in cell wall biosynthesis